MARLKLNPDPTFKLKVRVPVPGGDAEVTFTFKYRDREVMKAWTEQTAKMAEADALMDIAEGWDLADEFSRENVETLCRNYPGAAYAAVFAYCKELVGVREKN